MTRTYEQGKCHDKNNKYFYIIIMVIIIMVKLQITCANSSVGFKDTICHSYEAFTTPLRRLPVINETIPVVNLEGET